MVFTYSAMDRIPERDRVRINYRYRDALEGFGCRTCIQKCGATIVPFIAGWVYFKEYQLKYGHYPVLRAAHVVPGLPLRQMVHWAIPIAAFSIGFWWVELSWNRCALGLQGAEPLPDQVIKKN